MTEEATGTGSGCKVACISRIWGIFSLKVVAVTCDLTWTTRFGILNYIASDPPSPRVPCTIASSISRNGGALPISLTFRIGTASEHSFAMLREVSIVLPENGIFKDAKQTYRLRAVACIATIVRIAAARGVGEHGYERARHAQFSYAVGLHGDIVASW